MRLPKMRELYNPIMELLYRYEFMAISDIRRKMLDYFYIDEDYVGEDGITIFNGRVNNVCSNMTKDGMLERKKQGAYALTVMGNDIVKRHITITGRVKEDYSDDIEQQFVDINDLMTVANISIFDTRVNNMLEVGAFVLGPQDKKDAENDIPIWISENCRFYRTADYENRNKVSNDSLNWFRTQNEDVNYERALEFHRIIRNADSFNEIFSKLTKYYKLPSSKLARLTGISETMIKRMRNKDILKDDKILAKDEMIIGRDDMFVSLQNLVAIFIMLRVHPMLFDDCLDVVRFSGSKEAIFRYKIILESAYASVPDRICKEYVDEINEKCNKLMVEPIFKYDEKKGITAWDDIDLV